MAADPDSSFVPPIPTLAEYGGAPLYLTGEDNLKLTVFNAAAGVTVALTGRTLPFGSTRPSPFKQLLIPATDRSASTVILPLDDGWLLNAQVVVAAGSPAIGQTFVRVSVIRGITSQADEVLTLFADYVTAKQPASYPDSPIAATTDGAGAVRSITGSLPAAGAEVSEVVPTGARWMLLAFEADLTTAVAVANRVPQLTLDDGANVYARVSVNQNETASQTWRNSYQQGIPQQADLTRFIITTSIGCELMLGSGHRIRTVTAGIQGADQYAAPQYLVREWIEGA